MKSLGPFPLLFALALCFGTTSCRSISEGLTGSSVFAGGKSATPPVVAPKPVEDSLEHQEPWEGTVYYIQGEVNEPGKKRMEGRTSFSQATALAGGVTDYAHPKRVYIRRGSEQYVVDRIKREQNPHLDFEILPGDVIIFPRNYW